MSSLGHIRIQIFADARLTGEVRSLASTVNGHFLADSLDTLVAGTMNSVLTRSVSTEPTVSAIGEGR